MDQPLALPSNVGAYRSANNSVKYRKTLLVLTLLWCVPTGLTLLDTDPARIGLATLIVGMVSFGLMLWRPSTVLIGLPFFALLSPAGGFIEFLGARAVLTDWLMVGLFAQVIVLYLGTLIPSNRQLQKNSATAYMFPLVAVYLMSLLVGFLLGNVISTAPLYYLLGYVLIYHYFSRYARTKNEWETVLNGWCVAAVLGSLILLHAFFLGKPLVNFALDTDLYWDRSSSIYYVYRASYYYAGFHFVAGILTVGILLRLIFKHEPVGKKMLFAFMVLILVMALFAMLNKTAIVAAMLSFFIVYIVVGVRLKRLNIIAFTLPLILGFSLVFFFVSRYGNELYESADLLVAATSTSSLSVRLGVWTNALQQLFQHPWHLMVGLGPNVIENGSQEVAEFFKVSAVTGNLEGALDSSWLTYLIELGIIGWLLIIAIFFQCFFVLLDALRHLPAGSIANPVFLTVFSGLVYLVFAFVSQSLGYAKISWLPFQIVLIAFAYGRTLSSRG